MTRTRPSRRELLAGLGIGSASTLLWACGSRPSAVRSTRGVTSTSGEVRTWLRDAVARLAVAYPSVHALAVARRRTTAAIDVLGAGVARARREGLVLTVRDREGLWREQVTSDLSQAGVLAAVRALVGTSTRKATIDFGPPPAQPPAPPRFADAELHDQLETITERDKLDSRIVYAAAMIDLDDANVWSIAPTHDREQRLVRVRKHVVRAAWNGTRPVVSEAERSWIGGLDDHALDVALVRRTSQRALELMTPGVLEARERTVILDPSLTASLVDAIARALLTTASTRRPEVGRALVAGTQVAAPLVTLVDDPTVPTAYGGFVFDDEGDPATPVTLVSAGRFMAVLSEHAGGGRGRGRRPGHTGRLEPAPSHLRLAPGTTAHAALGDEGLLLEEARTTIVEPGMSRVIIGAARARELRGGQQTGRVYGEVELVGDLRTLLGAISGVSSDTNVSSYRDDRDGEPRWRSVEAPWVRTTGLVRLRRGFA
ncbi:MAG: peptidase modulator of gyrase [Deltaproteobacteria bacterium]|nr:peptidase modulator of gyrase [Deltaproteobacteria bacterium]